MSQKLIINNMPDAVINQLDEKAEAQGVPRTSIIKQILYDATKPLETGKKPIKKGDISE